MAKGTEELVEPHGLTPTDYALLRLFLRSEKWTATQISEMLPVQTSRISRLVAKLTDMGLMRRRRPQSDRRLVFLTLTHEGKALTQDLFQRIEAYEARLLEGVSDEEMSAFVSTTSRAMANYARLIGEEREVARMLSTEASGQLRAS